MRPLSWAHLDSTTILKGWNHLAQGCEERATLGLLARNPATLKDFPRMGSRALDPGTSMLCASPLLTRVCPKAPAGGSWGGLHRSGKTRVVVVPRCSAAAREGGCARGCESHPSNWTVHDGTARCLSPRKAARGVSSPGIEPMGLNEDEPQLMSLVMTYNRSRRVPGAWMKADAAVAGQCLS